MLVLERPEGGAVVIGNSIRVEVKAVRGKKAVRLAISAPKAVPIVREELVAAAPVAPTSATMPDQRPAISVAVVEDNPDHRRLITLALTVCGVGRVLCFESVGEAIRGLGRAAEGDGMPSLVLVDYRLPDGPGSDVVRAIRGDERLKRTPVVVLSAEDQDPAVEECLREGANSFVVKHPDFKKFTESVYRITDYWRSARPARAGA